MVGRDRRAGSRREALVQLRSEFLLNDSVRVVDRAAHQGHAEAASALLALTLGDELPALEELYAHLVAVYSLRTHAWSGGSLRSLIDGGDIAIISSSELRAALAAWPDLMADLYEDETKDWDFTILELRPAINAHLPSLAIWGQTRLVPSALSARVQVPVAQFETLFASRAVQNALATRLANKAELVSRLYPPIDRESQRIVGLIDVELDRLGGGRE